MVQLKQAAEQAVGKDSGEYKYDDAKEVLLKSHKLGEYANHQSEEHGDGNNAEGSSSSRSKRKRSTNDADEIGASGGPNKELRKALRGLGGLVRRYADNPADGDEEGAKKMGFASNSYLKVSRLIREHLDDNDIELSDPEKQLKHIKGIGKKSIDLCKEYLEKGTLDSLEYWREYFGLNKEGEEEDDEKGEAERKSSKDAKKDESEPEHKAVKDEDREGEE